MVRIIDFIGMYEFILSSSLILFIDSLFSITILFNPYLIQLNRYSQLIKSNDLIDSKLSEIDDALYTHESRLSDFATLSQL